MPCYWPRRGWRLADGVFTIKEPDDGLAVRFYHIPCGGCIGCRVRQARDWAIRCQLELAAHTAASWVTLTYDEKYCPPTLDKSHLSSYLKRLRARLPDATIRFLGVGEYGTKNERPHYHAILYGIDPQSRHIDQAWRMGFTHADVVTPANVAYTAGYAQKKLGSLYTLRPREEVDPDTGECFRYQPPFRLCSRRPGIGGHARVHRDSWRSRAIYNAKPVPVPRYLHESWRDRATLNEIEELDLERLANAQPLTVAQRAAGEKIAQAKYDLDSQRRSV